MTRMSENRTCKAIKVGGGRCRNRAKQGHDYCWSHSRETAEERKEYARAGGYARSRRRPDELTRIKADIRTVTAAVLRGGLDEKTQTIDKGTAAVLFQGMNTLLRAIETERKLDRIRELEENVDELRGRLAELRRAQWGGG